MPEQLAVDPWSLHTQSKHANNGLWRNTKTRI